MSHSFSFLPLLLLLQYLPAQASDPKLVLTKEISFGRNDSWDDGAYYPNEPFVLENGDAFFRSSRKVWKFDRTKNQVLAGAELAGYSWEEISASSVISAGNGRFVVGHFDGRIFWLDSDGKKIGEFDTEKYLKSIGAPIDDYNSDHRITSNPLLTRDGHIVIASNSAVWFFDSAGKLLNHYLTRPKGVSSRFEGGPIELDDGQVFVANALDGGRAYYFSSSGELRKTLQVCYESGHQGRCGSRATAKQTASGLIALASNGYVSFLTRDGKIKAHHEVEDPFLRAPLELPNSDIAMLGSGMLYFFSKDGDLKSTKRLNLRVNTIGQYRQYLLLGEMQAANSVGGRIELFDTSDYKSYTFPTFGEVEGFSLWGDQIYVLEEDQMYRKPSRLRIFQIR